MEECLQKRLEPSKLVSIVWKCSEQNYQQTIDVTGTDLSRLRQQWESAAAEQCWLNDNVNQFVLFIGTIHAHSPQIINSYTILIANSVRETLVYQPFKFYIIHLPP